MKIKTITASTPGDLDDLVNAFEKEHLVRFTQTHVTAIPLGSVVKVQYTAILFMEGQ